MQALYPKPRIPQARARRTRFFRHIVTWPTPSITGQVHFFSFAGQLTTKEKLCAFVVRG